MKLWIVILAAGLAAASCDDGASRTPTETDVFNVYFYFPDGKEKYVGRAIGISACQRASHSFANSAGLPRNSRWSYICCREHRGSSCYDKYR